jgi:hypothetical protein
MRKGNFLARLGEERHAKLAQAAGERGTSVNQLVCDAVDLMLEGGGMSSSEARKAVLAELADVLPRLAQGFVLVPSAEAGSNTWADLMNGGEPS